MHRSLGTAAGRHQCLLDVPLQIPFGMLLRGHEVHTLPDHQVEGSGLADGLSHMLPDPLDGAVGRHHHQGHMPLVSLGHGGSHIEQCRTRGDTHRHGSASLSQREPQGKESRTAFISDGETAHPPLLADIVEDGCVATARTGHHLLHAMGMEQCGEQSYLLIFVYHKSVFSSSSSWLRSPSIPSPPRCRPATRLRQRAGNGHRADAYSGARHRDATDRRCRAAP